MRMRAPRLVTGVLSLLLAAVGAGMIGQTEFNNRCSRRLWSNPDYWSEETGFRCAKDSP